ncbi:MAG: flagellin [Myxococcales bacterium]|mgnify:CR=1 FL=1|nr:flagellin [Myxococcales bacterium]
MGIKVNDTARARQMQRNMNLNKLLLSKNFERLSSGLRINRASDDAAGLSISSRIDSQVRGIGQAMRNAGDGVSAAQTADAGLNSVTENLQRMRELAVQASNGTLTGSDRKAIQSEIDQLTDEIGSIGERTTFNGRKLIGGQADSFSLQVGANSNETVELPNADVRVNQLGSAPAVTSSSLGANGVQAGDLSINGVNIRATQAVDDQVSTVQSSGSAIAVAAAINDSTASTGVSAIVNETGTTGGQIAGGALDSQNQLVINGTAVTGLQVEAGDAGDSLISAINAQADLTGVTAQRDRAGGVALSAQDGRNIDIQATGNAEAITGLSTGTTQGTVTVRGDAQFDVAGADPSAAGLSAGTVGSTQATAVNAIDVTTQAGANDALETIDRALEQVTSQRSRFGATQNRLESTINNLSNTSQNLQESNSRIRDADFAKEASELLRRQILEQAQISILGQSNKLSKQSAIKLLGGA